MAKKKTTTRKPVTRALIIRQVELRKAQQELIQQPTPAIFIKERTGRGKNKVKYVEGGYVLAQLNRIFGSVNWEFKIIEKEIHETLKTVWVYGELTIIDHAKGWRVTKGQYGQHDFATGVPLGDTLKAAGTDSLKKCASMFGIALDVYWQQLDTTTPEQPPQQGNKKLSKEQAFEQAKLGIKSSKNPDVLIETDKRIQDSKLYNDTQRKQLHSLISQRVDSLMK